MAQLGIATGNIGGVSCVICLADYHSCRTKGHALALGYSVVGERLMTDSEESRDRLLSNKSRQCEIVK